MEYKEIKFKKFLEDYEIVIKELPEPIQEKIDIFWRMHKLLETIQECDLQELLMQIEILDYEILQDVFETVEDRMPNNDIMEIPVMEAKEIKVKPKKEIEVKRKVSSKGKTDEDILDELVKIKRTTNIGKSEFEEMGLKTKLGRSVVIGKYVLKRTSIFFRRYDIIMLEK